MCRHSPGHNVLDSVLLVGTEASQAAQPTSLQAKQRIVESDDVHVPVHAPVLVQLLQLGFCSGGPGPTERLRAPALRLFCTHRIHTAQQEPPHADGTFSCMCTQAPMHLEGTSSDGGF